MSIFTASLSSTYLSDIEKNSSLLSSFTIRVPPPLILSDVPLRERRGFTEFISIIPRPEHFQDSAPMPAKGQLEPRAGALPRRRRASSNAKSVITQAIICESRIFDFASSDSDSSDEED
ncbi:hypothetical protein BT96DRAFT_131653 [Gymnopus androsaceus JB14]|uniref:Uncharacterized protein n=1 Tax=Gymnopus androsaceus JB14 TaxID=1447944 RepID=A0A6A4I9T1_9AGAR|nr:hypothetical protein BT96DRAFT_131653 [Gymnopus androsaceus JB14]